MFSKSNILKNQRCEHFSKNNFQCSSESSVNYDLSSVSLAKVARCQHELCTTCKSRANFVQNSCLFFVPLIGTMILSVRANVVQMSCLLRAFSVQKFVQKCRHEERTIVPKSCKIFRHEECTIVPKSCKVYTLGVKNKSAIYLVGKYFGR